MDHVIGIDIGTGSVKAVAMDLKGTSFQVCQHYYPFSEPRPGYHEQDPLQIWEAFQQCLKEMLQQTGGAPLAIGLSSAMHSLIAVNEHGASLAPMITWADNRSAAVASMLRASETGNAIYEATGTPIHAMSPLCKLIWLREQNYPLFKAAARFISIKEYIWYRLFGEFVVDYSIASCTGLFNIHERGWHPASLALAGITEAALSLPVPTDYTRMFHAGSRHPGPEFLPAALPFVIGASDGCLANLGSGAYEAGSIALTIGTSGAVRMASPVPLPDPVAMTFSYILDKNTFICGGPINNGGLALQWWLKTRSAHSGDAEDYSSLFEEIAGIPAGSNGLIFVPYITGERAPVWDSESCGVFFGIRSQHNQAHFSRAVAEGICYAIKEVLERVAAHTSPLTHIHISGGILKSNLWMQLLADITGLPLTVADNEDASAAGAAMMAVKSVVTPGKYPSFSSVQRRQILPDARNASVHAANFSVYRQLYPVLKNTMHSHYRLNN